MAEALTGDEIALMAGRSIEEEQGYALMLHDGIVALRKFLFYRWAA